MNDGADWKSLLSQQRPRPGNPHVYRKSPPAAVIRRAGERIEHATRCITISVSLSRGSNPEIQRLCCGIQINDSFEFPLQLHEYSQPLHSSQQEDEEMLVPHSPMEVAQVKPASTFENQQVDLNR